MGTEAPDSFPWRAVYKALVRRICEVSEEDLSEMMLTAEVRALARVHSEVLEEGERHLKSKETN